jgi:hypothetical protein
MTTMFETVIPTKMWSVSELRIVNGEMLRGLKEPVLITTGREKEPLAFLVPYETYMNIQRIIFKLGEQEMTK